MLKQSEGTKSRPPLKRFLKGVSGSSNLVLGLHMQIRKGWLGERGVGCTSSNVLEGTNIV